MSNVIKPKRGSTDPAPGILDEGEIGINTSAATAFVGVAGRGIKKLNAARSEETDSVDTSGEATANGNRHIWFSDLDNEKVRAYNSNFQYNPSTNTISANVGGTSSNVTGTVSIAHGGTGATTRGGALKNFIVGDTYSGNINNLTTIGSYWLNLSNCQNGPASSGHGTMEVTRSTSNNYLQRFTFYMGMTYYRTFTNGQWYDWRALLNTTPTKVLWEGSLKTGTATITNGAKYAYLIAGGKAGANSNWVTQIIPNGWGSHMEIVDHQNQFLTYKVEEISGNNNDKLTILDNPYNGLLQWVWGINQYKD